MTSSGESSLGISLSDSSGANAHPSHQALVSELSGEGLLQEGDDDQHQRIAAAIITASLDAPIRRASMNADDGTGTTRGDGGPSLVGEPPTGGDANLAGTDDGNARVVGPPTGSSDARGRAERYQLDSPKSSHRGPSGAS